MKPKIEMLSRVKKSLNYIMKFGKDIFENLRKNNIWKRMMKNIVTTTMLVSISLIPGARNSIGKAAYLGAFITVFAHPGRRFGQMTEALILALSGTVCGLAWSIFGIFLSSLVIKSNPSAADAIRAMFLFTATFIHGFLRSRAPRVFVFVLLLIIVSVTTLTSVSTTVTSGAATQIIYPAFIAGGVILLVNVLIFPEFSSSFLGETAIKTLNETASVLSEAGDYFIRSDESTGAEIQRQSVNKKDKLGSNYEGSYSNVHEPTQHRERMKFSRLLRTHHPRTDTRIRYSSKQHASTGSSLSRLTANKGGLRTGFASCKAAQRECNFEIAFSVLPPHSMKPISGQAMKRLVANTIAVIGACESKYALGGNADHGDKSQPSSTESRTGPENLQEEPGIQNYQLINEESLLRQVSKDTKNLESLNPSRQGQQSKFIVNQETNEPKLIKQNNGIESGNAESLYLLLKKIKVPYTNLSSTISCTVDIVIACIAYTYNVPKVPSGARAPKGILIEEIDTQIEILHQALLNFDSEAAFALEGAALLQEVKDRKSEVMPREEVFLISSFLLNLRQAATHIQSMLTHSKNLVLEYQQRRGHRRIYAPRIKWSKWFYTGGGEEEALPTNSRKAIRQGISDEGEDEDTDSDVLDDKGGLLGLRRNGDLEDMGGFNPDHSQIAKTERRTRPVSEPVSSWMRLRGQTADVLEWVKNSDDVVYAFKLTTAVFLVLWPAFVPSWTAWYSLNRGLWAALQLILVTEVSIGTSVMTFLLRGIGTTLGCLWGWAAWEIYSGNRIVCAIIICIGLIPATYVQLGTKYPKAGMVSIISMCVVALATELETIPGTATENFLKRWIAFMIGGIVALIVELVLLPVKARTRMVESLAAAICQIAEMENCVASGIEKGSNFDVFNNEVLAKFECASGKATNALCAAETFLPFCSTEPRIKGSFQTLALIYKEIIFVLHQIVDRMENMFQLRTAYGSGPLEEFNSEIYPYRRNVAGSITLTLFAIHGALITKLPLPQFLPSARLAYQRLINHVKGVMAHHLANLVSTQERPETFQEVTELARRKRTLVRRKYISWQASSAAQAEVIEYLEELIDLTKLLVGASEFRSGLLTRPSYAGFMEMGSGSGLDDEKREDSERRVEGGSGVRGMMASGQEGDGVPASIRRIHSRKTQYGLQGNVPGRDC